MPRGRGLGHIALVGGSIRLWEAALCPRCLLFVSVNPQLGWILGWACCRDLWLLKVFHSGQ